MPGIVVFGATGHTGQLVARALVEPSIDTGFSGKAEGPDVRAL